MTAWNTRAEPDPEALVKAALGHAAETSKEIADQYVGYMSRIETAIRALASDPDAVARIIKDAEKERG